MALIKTIDTIVQPFYDLDRDWGGTLRVVEAIVEYARKKGRESDRVFVLPTFENYDTFGLSPNQNSLKREYFERLGRLVGDLEASAKNLILPRLYSKPDFSDEELVLNKMKIYQLDPSGIQLIGHGQHRGVCVRGFLERMEKVIGKEYPTLKVTTKENPETTLDSRSLE